MVSFNRVLCPIDFSDFSLDALQHAIAVARWYSAQLTLLHVYPATRPIAGEGPPPHLLEVDPAKMTEQVRTFCAPLLGELANRVEILVRPGDPAREIRAEADQHAYDLVILGTHGRSGFERLFLGSVTEKVIRTIRVPALTIPPPVRDAGSPNYKCILCPLDFSDGSIRALEYALSLAKAADARLILLHSLENVLGDVGARTLGHLNIAEYYRHLEQDALDHLKAVVPDEAKSWARPEERVVRGRAYQEILKVVAGEHVDLVVMGVQGKSVVDRLMFGSTTHRVIREAGCPVLSLHAATAGGQ